MFPYIIQRILSNDRGLETREERCPLLHTPNFNQSERVLLTFFRTLVQYSTTPQFFSFLEYHTVHMVRYFSSHAPCDHHQGWSGEEWRNVSELVASCRSLPTSTSDQEYTKVFFWYSLHASKLIHGTTRNVLYPHVAVARDSCQVPPAIIPNDRGWSNALATVVLDPSRATITTCISTPDFAGAKANPPGFCGLPADG